MDVLNEVFERKKSIGLLVGVAMVGAFEFSRIHVPDFIEKKFKYRCDYLKYRLVGKIARLGALLGVNKEPILFRKIVKTVGKPKLVNANDYPNIIYTICEVNNCIIRIYSPKYKQNQPQPVLFYFHGGGYVLNTYDSCHQLLLPLASELEIVIISVSYPLAPENLYPIPVEESFNIVKHFINNYEKYNININTNRVALSGNSSGGNICITLSDKLRAINSNIPKLQVLISPPTQYFNMSLPSMIKYTAFETNFEREKLLLWYMGLDNLKEYHTNFLIKNYHTLLLDESLRAKFRDYVNVDLIDEKYKKDFNYYDSYDKIQHLIYPNRMSPEYQNLDENFVRICKQVFNENISPGLGDDEYLKKQPKTSIIIAEYDTRKDENLIYAKRLQNNRVECDVFYYENAHHSSLMNLDNVGRVIRNDIINYIKNNL